MYDTERKYGKIFEITLFNQHFPAVWEYLWQLGVLCNYFHQTNILQYVSILECMKRSAKSVVNIHMCYTCVTHVLHTNVTPRKQISFTEVVTTSKTSRYSWSSSVTIGQQRCTHPLSTLILCFIHTCVELQKTKSHNHQQIRQFERKGDIWGMKRT